MGLLGKAGKTGIGAAAGRTGIGAIAGGISGGMSDNGSILGGAIGGAAVGAALTRGNIARLGNLSTRGMQAGLGYGAKGAGALRGAMPKLLSNRGYGNAAVGYGMAGLGAAGRGMNRAAGYIKRNSISANKYGGATLAGLGMGSAAMIGSSVLSSNRGY